jgi:hypothetical protein
MPSFALVATLKAESAAAVRQRLHTVPPFDLPMAGIEGHQAFVGTEHAAFLFWGDDPEGALVRASGREDVQRRVAQAIEGLDMPRKLEERFTWERPGHAPRAEGRTVAVLARGLQARDDAEGAGAHRLGEALGPALEREREFVGEGTVLFVFERAEEADGDHLLSLRAVGDASPIAPVRPLELLEQTFWFEAGDQLPPRPARDLILHDT